MAVRALGVVVRLLLMTAGACAPAPAGGGPFPSELSATAAPTASPTQAAARSPALTKGALLWQATLDASGSDLDLGSRYVMGDPTAATIRPIAGGIEVAILKTGGPTGASFKQSVPATFIGEMDFRVAPGSDIQFVWRVRSGDQLHLVKVDTRGEAMEFVYVDPADWPTRLQPIGPRIPIPGLLSGRVVTVAVVAAAPRYTLYLDGERVAEVSNPRLTPRALPLAFGAFGEKGLATIVGMRAYALAVP